MSSKPEVDVVANPSGAAVLRWQRVCDEVRRSILDGALPAGTRLREVELAQEYGVSRVPVREALRRLHAEGLVELTPNRGAVVVAPTIEEMRDLVDVRSVLERRIARRAARLRTDADLAELRAIVAEAQRAAATGDRETMDRCGAEFLAAVGRASRQRTASDFAMQLRSRLMPVSVGLNPVPAEERCAEMADVLDAIVRRDEDMAEAHVHLRLSKLLRAIDLRFQAGADAGEGSGHDQG